MARIFISYRRESSHVAVRIYEQLARAFGGGNIFIDLYSIPLAVRFPQVISRALDRSDALVAIIGPRWLETLKEREKKGEDWVRFEIEQAMERGLVIAPLLVEGAAWPDKQALPERLRGLADWHARTVSGDDRFATDMARVIGELTQELRKRGVTVRDGESRFWDQGEGRRRGWLVLLLVALLWTALLAWREWLPPAAIDEAALGNLLYGNCWVSYDPTGTRLDEARQPTHPPVEAIAAELDLIREAGFSGVVLSGTDNRMVEAPRLAKQRGLKVILGIWKPSDREEVSRAIRLWPHVDGYCVGHNGLRERYSMKQLREAIWLVKKRTGQPATTTELAMQYDDELAAVGDWLFPDAHITLKDDPQGVARVHVERDIELFMKATDAMARLAQRTGQPLLFKSVAYPHAGVDGGSRARQAEFFRRLRQRIDDPQRGHAVKVSFAAQGAFDTDWKLAWPFLAWDPWTGLLKLPGKNAAGQRPKRQDLLTPAAREILSGYPHLQGRQRRSDDAAK
jgi:hypothetical protein